jgi:hypothetical protein
MRIKYAPDEKIPEHHVARLCSVASVALSLLAFGVFVWGVDLTHPAPKDLLFGLLFCLGPVLSAPTFFILLKSQRWQRQIMWTLGFASFLSSWIAIADYQANGRLTVRDAISALPTTLQPVLMLPFVIAFLIEVSYRLLRSGHPPKL